jgi:hypothetical protein
MAVSDVVLFSLVEVYRRFGGDFCVLLQGDDLKIVVQPTLEAPFSGVSNIPQIMNNVRLY